MGNCPFCRRHDARSDKHPGICSTCYRQASKRHMYRRAMQVGQLLWLVANADDIAAMAQQISTQMVSAIRFLQGREPG